MNLRCRESEVPVLAFVGPEENTKKKRETERRNEESQSRKKYVSLVAFSRHFYSLWERGYEGKTFLWPCLLRKQEMK